MNAEDAKVMIQQVRAALESVGLPEGARSFVIVEFDNDDDTIAQVCACSKPDEAFDMMERAVKSMVGFADGRGEEIDARPS